MILKFSFDYNSNNNTLLYFLQNIVSKTKLENKIIRQKDIVLYVEGNEEELISFSDELSATLPMSIFLKNNTAEVVPEIPQIDSIKVNVDNKFAFCPSCLKQIEDDNSQDFYNPFISCSVCGTTCDVKSLILLKENEEIDYNSNKQLFEKLATLINEDKKVKIKTNSGEFVFKKLSKTEKKVKLLCTNLVNISKVLVANKKEIVALASLEKPSLDLRVNEVFKMTNTLSQEYVNVRYVDDLILYLLSKELENYNIDFLIYNKDEDYDYELTYKGDSKNLDSIKIKIVEDNTIILNSNSYDKSLDTIYSKFEDKAKAHFMVFLQEYNFYNKNIINFYSSTKCNDNICLYSKDVEGFLDIVSYKLPKSIKQIFDILQKDETSNRLLNNYKEKYPDIYENALNCDISMLKDKNIYSLWKIVAVVLGFSSKIEDENIVLNKAIESLLEKGPRIDYKLKDSDKIFNKEFLIHKLFQSGMSFKLAGVDDNTLCLGYIESFAHYIAKLVDDVHSEVPLDGISLTGDIFTYDLISKLVHKSITKNFKIYYNKDFVIQK
ncbi:hypothetical protein CPU12_00545 [Malaciobacter molluscorum LMG 25693]|uniref:Hydrogenase n=1 Tax=Malaciobacter molluscorum LMG 25693 TaxID=870501 RepID=A0A2G1DLF3_9BACT|nr:hypothetical protein [Malaciobacter molluscorum]AXX92070.1 hypothetical protein AMOL_1086 [Malaciobacter molluscorum LMG 25693]PHO19300.1 hypothetical protein CPU12_00545 [Malaciobacter molluscorum LMG 25693]